MLRRVVVWGVVWLATLFCSMGSALANLAAELNDV